MKKLSQILISCILILLPAACNDKYGSMANYTESLSRAETTLENVYDKYSVPNENLLRENYPFDQNYVATYLDNDSNIDLSNRFAYLWPYSGMFSAVNALYEVTDDRKYLAIIEDKILPGLEEYFDTERHPFAYSSYINRAPLSDRFYDDNIWIGIDYTDLYHKTKDSAYLEKAEIVWNFVYSGHDDKLGGGIYWVEQNRASKHSCSNAPAAVFALKLYRATKDQSYLAIAKELYAWTKENLQDKEDFLYCDNIRLDGHLDKKKYSYNSGQMLQAATILYEITKENAYLSDAQVLAKACHEKFFHDVADSNHSLRIFNNGNVWFSAVMSRGFLELYRINKDLTYLRSINESLEHAWNSMKDENGLFGTDWEGKDTKKEKWLLTQAAMIEMYARFANPDLK